MNVFRAGSNREGRRRGRVRACRGIQRGVLQFPPPRPVRRWGREPARGVGDAAPPSSTSRAVIRRCAPSSSSWRLLSPPLLSAVVCPRRLRRRRPPAFTLCVLGASSISCWCMVVRRCPHCSRPLTRALVGPLEHGPAGRARGDGGRRRRRGLGWGQRRATA